jgi:type III secretion system chaperone SycN
VVMDDWVMHTVREFGLGLGVSRFYVNDNGVACVHIENVGSLFIEPSENQVLVYLARDFGRLTLEELERSLALVYPLENHAMTPWCGLSKGSQLVFGVLMTKEEFDPRRLDMAIQLLRDLLDRVRPR